MRSGRCGKAEAMSGIREDVVFYVRVARSECVDYQYFRRSVCWSLRDLPLSDSDFKRMLGGSD